MIQKPRLLTTGQLARELGLHANTINRYVREGKLTPTETSLGGHRRWNLDDVRRQMRELAEAARRDE